MSSGGLTACLCRTHCFAALVTTHLSDRKGLFCSTLMPSFFCSYLCYCFNFYVDSHCNITHYNINHCNITHCNITFTLCFVRRSFVLRAYYKPPAVFQL